VRFVVPFTAGGATDVLTRLLCQRLSTEFNVPFIVENRGGAGGNVGGAAVAGAPNDGYTFLMGAPAVLSYNKALYREMRFDPDRELEPVSLFARLPNVLVVNPDVPARNVAELVAYAKGNPNKLNYGAIGAGATSFSFRRVVQIDGRRGHPVRVLQRDHPVADRPHHRPDPVGDRQFDIVPAGHPRRAGSGARHEHGGPVAASPRASHHQRRRRAGIRSLIVDHGRGACRHAADVTQSLAVAIRRIADAPDFRARIAELGAEPVGGTPAQAKAFVEEEAAKWQRVIAKTGVRVD
jgi:tripartite-type tricarboxylate transporter receptor subunit TctC